MSGTRGKTAYYWDTNIFIAWLTNERRDPNDVAGIKLQVDAIDRGEAHLVTSVITLSEVLDTGATRGTRDRLRQVFQRPNCHLVDVNRAIAEIAHNIRVIGKEQGRSIKTPDAIHMATAIFFGCPVFYTFDQANLPSSLSVNGKSLVIEKPSPTQYPLGL